MVKNKLEVDFSEIMHKSMKNGKIVFGMKLKSNQLTHNNNPADYILLSRPQSLVCSLVEAKLVTCKLEKNISKGRFSHARLKQRHALTSFACKSQSDMKSYLLLGYYTKLANNRWDKDLFMIPIEAWNDYLESTEMQSINHQRCLEIFIKYKMYKECLLDNI